jgi:hypothetical protein
VSIASEAVAIWGGRRPPANVLSNSHGRTLDGLTERKLTVKSRDPADPHAILPRRALRLFDSAGRPPGSLLPARHRVGGGIR